MKIILFIVLLLSIISIVSCKQQVEIDDEKKSIQDSLKIELPKKEFQEVGVEDLFMIEIPNYMQPNPDLNADAKIAYSYFEDHITIVKEFYLLVLVDTKEEIESYDLDIEFDAMSFSKSSLNAVVSGYDSYKIIEEEVGKEDINGSEAVIYEIEASLGDVNTYHQLAVIEGERAFYQILTWTLLEQKEEFKQPMKKIIYSFEEIAESN